MTYPYDNDEENDEGGGLGTAALLAAGYLASPLGRAERRYLSSKVPEWLTAKASPYVSKAGTMAKQAASAMTGGASELASRAYSREMDLPTYRDTMDAANIRSKVYEDMPFYKAKAEKKRDVALAKAQVKALAKALPEFFRMTPEAGRVVAGRRNIPSNEARLKNISAISEGIRSGEFPKASREIGIGDLTSEQKKSWKTFLKSDTSKLMSDAELSDVMNLYRWMPDVTTPEQAVLEYLRVLSNINNG